MTIPGTGLLDTGFVAPTVDEIVADISQQLLATIDPALDLSADQPMGQAVAIFADYVQQQWDTIGTVYAALDPDAAEGILLDNVSGITGVRRRSATYSYLYGVQLTLNATTTVNAGATISVNGNPGSVWALQATLTSTTAGVYAATFRSQVPGPQVANAGTATVINTPTTGWTAVSNPADAAQGIPEDTDTVLRQRRLADLGAASVGTVDGQESALLAIPGITAAYVIENTTNLPVGGQPPHSTHAVLWSGSLSAPSNYSTLANTIAQAIWSKKCAGIGTYGTILGNATDVLGNTHVISFDWATTVPLYIVCTVTPALGITIGSSQAAAVKAALAAYALANFQLGEEVYYTPLRNAAVVPGLTIDAPTFTLGLSPFPVGVVSIPITQLQIATLGTAQITVNGM